MFSSLLCSVLLVSCSSPSPAVPADETASSANVALLSSSAVPATSNVSYTGVVQELGVSIYQQGTHKLVLDDGRFIVLQSADTSLRLSDYIGKRVEVKGSVQPTTEAGGTIMTVEQIATMQGTSSNSSLAHALCGGIAAIPCPTGFECVDDPTDGCDPANGGADCSGICLQKVLPSSAFSSSAVASVALSSASSVAVVPVSSKSAAMVSSSVHSSLSSVASAVSSSSAPVSSSAASLASADIEAQIVLMAKEDYANDKRWTQKYCTTHIGFCIPASKNWYFVSFGTKAGTIWHVEFGSHDVTDIATAPIALDLVSGLSASKGQTDGAVEVNGSMVTGYKDWPGNRHFELTADVRLKAAVMYMIAHITPYEFTQ